MIILPKAKPDTEHEPRERDVGLKLNVLTQAVNKLHANCNQTEIIKRKSAK